jgi:hypothetical protein
VVAGVFSCGEPEPSSTVPRRTPHPRTTELFGMLDFADSLGIAMVVSSGIDERSARRVTLPPQAAAVASPQKYRDSRVRIETT